MPRGKYTRTPEQLAALAAGRAKAQEVLKKKREEAAKAPPGKDPFAPELPPQAQVPPVDVPEVPDEASEATLPPPKMTREALIASLWRDIHNPKLSTNARLRAKEILGHLEGYADQAEPDMVTMRMQHLEKVKDLVANVTNSRDAVKDSLRKNRTLRFTVIKILEELKEEDPHA